MSYFKSSYKNEIVPELVKRYGYKSAVYTPKLVKISLNMGLGDSIPNSKTIESAAIELSLISGQKALVTRAKKSIAGFKLREGMPIGCKVTLRGDRMYEFLDRLIFVALPRVRDFRGLSSKSFDGRGNYSFGLKEQIIFPEIDYDKIDEVRGMNVSIETTANTDDESKELLKLYKFPFAE